MKKIKIHFVCRGNTNRSRIAEAYVKSLKNNDWDISSSGIDADKEPRVSLSTFAKVTCLQNGISQWLSKTKAQTSSQLLQNNDIIIFMSRDVYQDAKKVYAFKDAICMVWHIKDREDWQLDLSIALKRRGTFRQIQYKVNHLVKDVSAGSWVDIVDENNENLGFKLPITIANQKGLWHRGCHAILTTPAGDTLVQKRSKNIIFSPNLIDITLGGHVDTGENPEQTMVREIDEEMGLKINPKTLRLIEIYRWNKYHSRYKLFERVFVYSYHVQLAENDPQMTIQTDEVQSVKILSPAQLGRLIRLHRLKNLGRLNYSYAYYLRIIKLAGVKIGL